MNMTHLAEIQKYILCQQGSLWQSHYASQSHMMYETASMHMNLLSLRWSRKIIITTLLSRIAKKHDRLKYYI